MSRDREDRLVAIVAAVNSPLPRREIFNRVDDDFDDEEDLAKTLGRMCADGRLVKTMRARFNKPDEAVYATPAGARLAAIAAAAGHVAQAANDGREHLRVIAPEDPPSTPPAPDKENDMGRKSNAEILEAVKDVILGAREPLSSGEIAKCAGVGAPAAKRALKALAAEGLAQASGKGRAARWAHGTPASVPAAPSAAVVPRKAPVAAKGATYAVESTGAVAISVDKQEVRIEPGDVAALYAFLGITEPIWKGVPAT